MQRARGPGRPARGLTCKGSVYALALNAPGSLVVAGTAESLVRVFDARTGGKVMKLRGHTGNVRRVPSMPTSCTALDLLADCRSSPAFACGEQVSSRLCSLQGRVLHVGLHSAGLL